MPTVRRTPILVAGCVVALATVLASPLSAQRTDHPGTRRVARDRVEDLRDRREDRRDRREDRRDRRTP